MPTNQKGFTYTTLLIIFFALSILVAAAYLIQLVYFNNPGPSNQTSNTEQTASSSASSCGLDCQKEIDSRFQTLKQELLKNPTATTPASTSTTSTSQVAVPKVLFVYFGVNGATESLTWIDLAGSDIKFNTAHYPGAKAFYFQADLQSDAPDRATHAWIYDVTHSSGVSGSEMSYAGLPAIFKEAGPLSFASGDLQLRVQLHSSLNNATIYNPRIKIVY